MRVNYIVFLFSVIYSMTVFGQQNKVLIIGIDGCRSDALQAANTPNIDELISNGIYSPDALNTDVTSSGPGWSAILTGAWSAKHQVTSNSFSNSNFVDYPPLMKYANEFSAEMNTVSIVHWAPINDDIIQDNADLTFTFDDDAEVSETAANYLSLNDPDMMFVHFDDVDHAGHLSGFSPDNLAYIEAIEGVDDLILPLMQAIESRPEYINENWLILVTTDHGGNGSSHGGGSFGERNIFVIASGNAIDQQLIVADLEPQNILNCLNESSELNFDGLNDFVEIPNNELFDFGVNHDFTVECRIRTSEAADVAIIGNKDWSTGLNPGFVFSFSAGTWKVNVGDGNERADINGGVVSDNEWHTLSVSFDRDGDMIMYEDGQQVNAVSIQSIGDINTGEGLFFGTDIDTDFDYIGALAEVRIWNEVLSPEDINNWQCSSVGDSHPSYDQLLGYWKMNESAGSIVEDYSVNGNEGIINGALWQVPNELLSYNYDDTPRSVDVSVTALAHLCVPIQEAWDLDGRNLIPLCSPDGVGESSDLAYFRLYPSNAYEIIYLEFHNNTLDNSEFVEIYNLTGKLVLKQKINYDQMSMDISSLAKGYYSVKVAGYNAKLFLKQ